MGLGAEIFGGNALGQTGSNPFGTGSDSSIFVGTAGTPGTGGTSNGFSLSDTGLGQLVTYGKNILSLPSQLSALQNAAPGTTTQQALQGSSFSDYITALFLRGVVIITGFIFVAEGLSMFKGNPSFIASIPKRLAK